MSRITTPLRRSFLVKLWVIAGTVVLVQACGGGGGGGGGTPPAPPAPYTVVTTLAGTAGSPGTADGTGVAARFNFPSGITTDSTNLYVADTSNHTIRQIVIATGAVTTLAGSAGQAGFADDTGAAARFNFPRGITTDNIHLYVTDNSNHTVRQIVIATGAVTTLAGSAGISGSTNGVGAAAQFNFPSGITTDGTNLYVADTSNHTVRQIVIATGAVTTLAGTAGQLGSTDGTGAAARFNSPFGIIITTDGTSLYLADAGNHTVRRIVIASGAVTTLAGSAGQRGSIDGTGAAARFNDLRDIATDNTNLYVTDNQNHTLRQIVIASGAVTTLAGSAGQAGFADGTSAAALFNFPRGITLAGQRLFITDNETHIVRAIQ